MILFAKKLTVIGYKSTNLHIYLENLSLVKCSSMAKYSIPTLFYSTWSKQSVLPGCHPSISNGMTQIPAKSRLMFHYIYYEYRRIMLLQTLGSFHNQTLKFAETPFQENWTLISMDSLVKNCSFLWKIDRCWVGLSVVQAPREVKWRWLFPSAKFMLCKIYYSFSSYEIASWTTVLRKPKLF